MSVDEMDELRFARVILGSQRKMIYHMEKLTQRRKGAEKGSTLKLLDFFPAPLRLCVKSLFFERDR